jgi:nitrite reductase/ring-hydroxylating ferredoxin subunit
MHRIGQLEDFKNNSTCSVQAGELALLVIRRGGRLFLYENLCPHTRKSLDPEGGSLLHSDGLLFECQRHAAQFVSDTGECVAGPCQGDRLRTIAYTLRDGVIYLE